MQNQNLNNKSINKGEGRGILIAFFIVPFISSIISTIHIIHLVALGNAELMSWVMAITYELGAITSFLVAMNGNVLKRIKRGALYFIFIVLFVLQALGNVYSTFYYIESKLKIDPEWLTVFKKLFYNTLDTYQSELVLSLAIGATVPLISLIFLKSAGDYFYFTQNENTEIKSEEKVIETKEELQPIKEDSIPEIKLEEKVIETKEEVQPIIPEINYEEILKQDEIDSKKQEIKNEKIIEPKKKLVKSKSKVKKTIENEIKKTDNKNESYVESIPEIKEDTISDTTNEQIPGKKRPKPILKVVSKDGGVKEKESQLKKD